MDMDLGHRYFRHVHIDARINAGASNCGGYVARGGRKSKPRGIDDTWKIASKMLSTLRRGLASRLLSGRASLALRYGISSREGVRLMK
jgi:hypothetical protein